MHRGHFMAPTLTRRDMLLRCANGFGLVALAGLLARGQSFLALAQRQGPVASVAASLMKLGVTEMLFDVATLRGDIAGANAMLENDVSLGMLGAPAGRIAGGTTQVQRNIIGERILGLPKEPRS